MRVIQGLGVFYESLISEQYFLSFTTVHHSAHSKTRHALIGTCKKSSERKNHFAKYKKKFRTENFFSSFHTEKGELQQHRKMPFHGLQKSFSHGFSEKLLKHLQRHLLLFFHSCFDKKQNILVAYKTVLSFVPFAYSVELEMIRKTRLKFGCRPGTVLHFTKIWIAKENFFLVQMLYLPESNFCRN